MTARKVLYGLVCQEKSSRDGLCFIDENGEWEKMKGKVNTNCIAYSDLSAAPPHAFYTTLHDTQQFPVKSLYKTEQRKVCKNNDSDYAPASQNAGNIMCSDNTPPEPKGYTVDQMQLNGVMHPDKFLVVAYGLRKPGDSSLEQARQSAWNRLIPKSANIIEDLAKNLQKPEFPIRLFSLTCWTACCTDLLSQ